MAIAITMWAFAQEARAEVRYDSDSRADAFAASLSFDHSVGPDPNRLLLVAVVMGVTTTRVSSVRFGGAALTAVGEVNAPGNSCRVELWQRIAPATGRQGVEVQITSGTHLYAVAISYSGVDPSDPTSAAATASGNGNTATVSLASAADQTVVDWVCAGGGNVVGGAPAAGQTRRDSWAGDPAGGVSERTGASPTVEMTWRSVGSFNWAIGAVALHAATTPPDGGATDAALPPRDGAPSDGPVATVDASEPDPAFPDGAATTEADADVPQDDDGGFPVPPREDGTATVKLAVGCACHTAGGPPAPSMLTCLGLLLAAVRRRRV